MQREKGFLMLRSDIRAERNVTQLSITIPRDAPCLGNPLLRATLDHMVRCSCRCCFTCAGCSADTGSFSLLWHSLVRVRVRLSSRSVTTRWS